MGKYDWCFITEKDGIFEQDHSVLHGGGGEGRDILFVAGGLLGPGFGISWGVTDAPHAMKNLSNFLDYDHIMVFSGADLNNLKDFDADIEFTIDGEKHEFSEPTFVRNLAFLDDGPVVIKRVGKPFMFTHIFWTSQFHHPGWASRHDLPPGDPRAKFGPPGGVF